MVNTPISENWFAPGFDDAGWQRATEYSEADVEPKQPYFDADFAGAAFVWTAKGKKDSPVNGTSATVFGLMIDS